MDSISQAALGASIGEVVIGRKAGYKGAVWGAVIATIPDLDVLLLPFFDAYERIAIHRGYSHSILFSVIAAILLVIIFRKTKVLKGVSNARLMLFAWLVLITHMLLDAFTPYGTQLFLPVSNARISFDSITIVDPVYTLPLLAGLILALTIYRNKPVVRRAVNYAGLIGSTGYLVFTLFHKSIIEEAFRSSLQSRNIEYGSLFSVPVTAANIKWYGVASGKDSIYMATMVSGQRSAAEFTAIPVNEYLLNNVNPDLAEKLKWFAKNHYTVAGTPDSIRFYNLQVDMQGIYRVGNDLAPTAWYYLILPQPDGTYQLQSMVHDKGDR